MTIGDIFAEENPDKYKELLNSEETNVIIGGGETDAERENTYGPTYKSCGGNCYDINFTECSPPDIGPVCELNFEPCPNDGYPTSCYNPDVCKCLDGNLICE